MKRSYTEFLQDILDAIAEIELFMTGVSFHTFESNREKILASDRRVCYPELSWKSIAGMKDILVHEYWEIDVAVVWATIQDSLPSLKEVVRMELEGNLG
jgi:uncharacterized protein with HEPN domain